MNRYADASALRQAIETRLKQTSDDDGTDLGRLRRIFVFDRLLSRLALAPRGQWILKGGAALEFRLSSRARATKDLDVATRAEDDESNPGSPARCSPRFASMSQPAAKNW